MYCDRALALSPRFVLAWGNKGNVLVALGRYIEALHAYDRARNYDSSFPEDNETVLRNKAVARSKLGLIAEEGEAERQERAQN